MNRQEIGPTSLLQGSSRFQGLTAHDFSIIRLCEIDGSVVDTARGCRFLVRNARGWEDEVVVVFDEDLIGRIQSQRRTRLLETSVLWLVCAQQCLAKYIWENDSLPDEGRLNISELLVDELLLATHWSDRQSD